ncbi:hypothetical protein [Saccharibacter floricola]|uniref:Uncharacterized protein n=1 Tax=Saccharibacter floricola DSM 15669 TaxID=1123227 RepID=A0ABQ0P1J5_9PROT|nr:hypothetical protein [Saccharibacter floricola]GBQ08755.1 hypothetical protein AA15669_1895 [Saccharibacter floricola DSM 15669]
MSLSKVLDKAGRTLGQLAYVNSPILLTDGIANKMGGTVPIMFYTQLVGTLNGLISGAVRGNVNLPNLDNTWCHWQNVQGNTLIDNTPAQYPYANQTVAANALVTNPTNISMQMICPPRGPGAMLTKILTIQSLVSLLNKHCQLGGYFNIITPGQFYTKMLLTNVADSSPHADTQPAVQYTFKFTRPLTQKNEAAQKMSTLMTKASGGMSGIGDFGSTGSGNVFDTPLSYVPFL